MNTVEQLRRALGLGRERELAGMPFKGIPTKRQVKRARKSFIKIARASQADSMLNMPKPTRHRPVPLVNDAKTKTLLAAHARRREAGWIRG